MRKADVASLCCACMIVLSSWGTVSQETSPDKLAPFSLQLSDQQPRDAFASVYRVGENHLVWLGAKHATRTDTPTFRLIDDAYRTFAFDIVIVEGCPTSWGPNSKRLIRAVEQSAASEKDGFQRRGEIVPAVLGAVTQRATVFCGEPSDSDVKSQVLAGGFTPEDVLGFYTLRSIPQWIRENRIVGAGDSRVEGLLIQELEVNRVRLSLDKRVLPSVDDWQSWYRRTNGRPLGADFTTEETGPRLEGPFASNAIGAAISMARATYLHELVISKLRAGNSVLVVYGASHLMIHEPALEASLGLGCRTLTDEPFWTLADCR